MSHPNENAARNIAIIGAMSQIKKASLEGGMDKTAKMFLPLLIGGAIAAPLIWAYVQKTIADHDRAIQEQVTSQLLPYIGAASYPRSILDIPPGQTRLT